MHSFLGRQRLPNGQIANAIGKKCVGAAGDAVVLTSCDEGSAWETQANGARMHSPASGGRANFGARVQAGQMKLARAGDYCLSQEGPAAGVEDAAARGAITASSTADNMAHGANMAVDGSSNTFWVGGRLLSFGIQTRACWCGRAGIFAVRSSGQRPRSSRSCHDHH